jgi:hypothetical protein
MGSGLALKGVLKINLHPPAGGAVKLIFFTPIKNAA